MGILKVSHLDKLFHEAGVKRVTTNAKKTIDEAVMLFVKALAKDTALVYKGRLIETSDLIRVSGVKGGYVVDVKALESMEDLDIEELLEEEPLPEGAEKDIKEEE